MTWTPYRHFAPLSLAAAMMLAAPMAVRAEAPLPVVVTIKPIHSIATAVGGDAIAATLLLDGAQSPHTYAMKPSEAKALQAAAMVIWVGEGLETFLKKPLRSVPKSAEIVELMAVPGLTLLDYRDLETLSGDAKGHSDKHGHNHGHDHGDDHSGADPHVWLSPANAKTIARHLAARFTAKVPARAADIAANLATFEAELATLEAELATAITPAKGKPFAVFHDAYQYFETAFGIEATAAIAISPERQPGAKHIARLRKAIEAEKLYCVFAEPQFEPKLVASLIADTRTRSGILDPLGAGLEAGPGQYRALLTNLARDLKACLVPATN